MDDLKSYIREVPDFPKPGKLPAAVTGEDYDLEYGSDRLEVHTDAVESGERVLIIDDLLATGGTALAATRLIETLGGTVVGLGFIAELSFLEGRQRIADYSVESLITY